MPVWHRGGQERAFLPESELQIPHFVVLKIVYLLEKVSWQKSSLKRGCCTLLLLLTIMHSWSSIVNTNFIKHKVRWYMSSGQLTQHLWLQFGWNMPTRKVGPSNWIYNFGLAITKYLVPTCELCEQSGSSMKELNMFCCYNEVYNWTLSVQDYRMSAIKR